ncbi:MAG: dihydropyrimidinase [Collinsella sp.]|nr:dihydropyrimidinase [Collinsella sp.]
MIIIKGGELIAPEGPRIADLALDEGRIARIADSIEPAEGDTVEDARGCWVFPGFIDAHTHLQCWTGMDWTADSFETGTRAAACGGTTTIVDYATADRGVSMPHALGEWHARARGRCTANYAFHMALAEWGESSAADLALMRERGVSSFKTYLAYDHLRLDDAETLQVLEALKPLGGLLCVHCENGTIIDHLQRRVLRSGLTGPAGHPASRPAECEAEAISRLLYLARMAGDAPVNVVHLSTELGLEAIRAARSRGQANIFVETCPQYLFLDESRYHEKGEDGFAGAKYVMSPPLRSPSDTAALRRAVVEGEIDTIATDHCSFNLRGQKDRGRGDFTAIPNGGPGVEHRPVVMLSKMGEELGPHGLMRLMSENPARVFGMFPRKGCLAEGSDADICVWDPRVVWTISASTQHQAVDYTPWEGMEVRGRAARVYVNGLLAVVDGEPTGALPGCFVER